MGLKGKKFKIIKFRSMVENAEELLTANKALYEKYINNSYKLPPNEDPRLTNIGDFIRKTSIDEIPQFINLMLGDMSLIGPRPILENELEEYSKEEQQVLLSVRPGITGMWQVSGRSEVYYPERCEMELYYPRNQSFLLDVKIFFLTIKKVLSGEGAH
ncbi:TPA: sugar transferase [Streptococcus pneumoniae]|nr:sugar transferase [Streptococcus pneumoniae]